MKLTRNIDSYVEYTANNDSTFDVSKFFTPYPAEGNVISYKLLGANTKEGVYGNTNLGTLTGKTFKVGANLENNKGISDTLYVAAEITTKAAGYTLPKDAKLYQDTVMIVINKAIAYLNEKNERTILTADKYTTVTAAMAAKGFDGTFKAGTYYVESSLGSTPKISGDVTFILANELDIYPDAIDDAKNSSTLNIFREADVAKTSGGKVMKDTGILNVGGVTTGSAITNFKAINIYGGTVGVYSNNDKNGGFAAVGNISVYNDATLNVNSSKGYGIKFKDGGKLTVAGGTVNITAKLNDIELGFAVIGDIEVSKGIFTATNTTYRAVSGNLTAGGKILIKESNDNNTWTAIEGTTSTSKYIKAQETSKTWK